MGKFVASVAALTLAAVGSFATAGSATAGSATAGSATAPGDHREDAGHVTKVFVHGDGSTVTLSRNAVPEGRVAFKVSTSNSTPGAGSQITLFKLVGNTTLAKFKADLLEEFSPNPLIAAKGTRHLNRDARFFGLADVGLGTPATVTERLKAGKYHLMDLANSGAVPNPTFTTFRVWSSHPHRDDGARGSDGLQAHSQHFPVVKMTSADRFDGPRTLPARGTVTVKNVSGTIHFMEIVPVKKGTSDKQIQAFLAGVPGTPDPLVKGAPSVGLDVLSPGRQADLKYKLPRGTYVLLCFIADSRTGMPHAVMGMHKVVRLK